MRVAANPFVDEGIRISFSRGKILRAYFLMAAVLSVVLFFWWPAGSFVLDLPAGGGPRTFPSVAIGLCICCAYIGARCGAEDYSPQKRAHLREYVALTPVSLFVLVVGKAAFALLHTLFLLALGAPFVLASLAVSGTAADRALGAFLVIGAFSFAFRMYGLLLLALIGARRLLRDMALLASGVLFLVITLTLTPVVNPVSALSGLSTAGPLPAARFLRVSIPFFLVSVIIDLLAALAFAAGTLASLRAARRRETREKSE